MRLHPTTVVALYQLIAHFAYASPLSASQPSRREDADADSHKGAESIIPSTIPFASSVFKPTQSIPTSTHTLDGSSSPRLSVIPTSMFEAGEGGSRDSTKISIRSSTHKVTPSITKSAIQTPAVDVGIEPVVVSSTPWADDSNQKATPKKIVFMAIVLSSVIGLMLFTLLLVHLHSRRIRKQDAKNQWTYLTPSPKSPTRESFFPSNILDKHREALADEKDYQRLSSVYETDATVTSLLTSPPQSKPAHTKNGSSKFSTSFPVIQWLKFIPPVQVPPPAYFPQRSAHDSMDRDRRDSTKVIDITKNFPGSKFSVTSSDYGEGCVGDRRGQRKSDSSLESFGSNEVRIDGLESQSTVWSEESAPRESREKRARSRAASLSAAAARVALESSQFEELDEVPVVRISSEDSVDLSRGSLETPRAISLPPLPTRTLTPGS